MIYRRNQEHIRISGFHDKNIFGAVPLKNYVRFFFHAFAKTNVVQAFFHVTFGGGDTPRHLNTGLVSSGVSLTSWGEGAYLALVSHSSSDGITIKIPYGQMFYYVDHVLLPRTTSFPIGLVKTKFDFIVRSVETGLG